MVLNESHVGYRLVIVALAGILVYFSALSILFPSAAGSGGIILEGNFVAGASSLVVSLIGMTVVALLIFRPSSKGGYSRQFEREETVILKRPMKQDETRLLEKIREVPSGITQDALRFRLGWPRETVDTLITNLERMGKVKLEEFGSTRKVFYMDQEKKQKN